MNCIICKKKLSNPVVFNSFVCGSSCQQKSACFLCANDYLEKKRRQMSFLQWNSKIIVDFKKTFTLQKQT